jgi:hypothetical protein
MTEWMSGFVTGWLGVLLVVAVFMYKSRMGRH